MIFEYSIVPDASPSKTNNVVLECDKDHFKEVLAALDNVPRGTLEADGPPDGSPAVSTELTEVVPTAPAEPMEPETSA